MTKHSRPNGQLARATTILVSAFIGASSVVLLPTSAQAAQQPFSRVFSENTPGNISLVGNSMLTCSHSPYYTGDKQLNTMEYCMAARDSKVIGNAKESLANNGYPMVYVDVDKDSSTFNSSSATLNIPSTASVAYAMLVWGGKTEASSGVYAPPTPSVKNTIKFKAPNASSYTTLTDTTIDPAAGGAYQGSVDVTDLVREAGSGEYMAGNLQTSHGSGQFGGWSLIVAYRDATEPMRNLTIFRGFQYISEDNKVVSADVSGFTTPTVGDVRSQVGVVAYEGDDGYVGDQMLLNKKNVQDGQSPIKNVFNSRTTQDGVVLTDRNPNYKNTFGLDVKRFALTNYLANGAQSANLSLTTDFETYFVGATSFATELYAPAVSVKQTVQDTNGRTLRLGDTASYTLTASNTGPGQLDRAVDTVVVQPIPAGLSIVPGSIRMDGAPVPDSAYNALTHKLTYKVGTLDPNASRVMTYDTRVDSDVVNGQKFPAEASVAYSSDTLGEAFSGFSNKTLIVADVPKADLYVKAASTNTRTNPGGSSEVSYTVVVGNKGPQTADGSSVAITLPTGFKLTKSDDAAHCVDLVCRIEDLAPGTERTLYFTATTPSLNADATTTFTGRTAASDTDLTNNKASVSPVLNSAPTANADTADVVEGKTVRIETLLSNDTDPDGDALSIVSVGKPGNGSVSLNVDGSVSYTPKDGFTGVDTFTYTVSDGLSTSTTTVKVTVAPKPVVVPPVVIPDPPVVVVPDPTPPVIDIPVPPVVIYPPVQPPVVDIPVPPVVVYPPVQPPVVDIPTPPVVIYPPVVIPPVVVPPVTTPPVVAPPVVEPPVVVPPVSPEPTPPVVVPENELPEDDGPVIDPIAVETPIATPPVAGPVSSPKPVSTPVATPPLVPAPVAPVEAPKSSGPSSLAYTGVNLWPLALGLILTGAGVALIRITRR